MLTKATRLVLVSIADDRSLGCSVCPGVRPPAADSKGFVQVSELHIAEASVALIVQIASFNIAMKERKKMIVTK